LTGWPSAIAIATPSCFALGQWRQIDETHTPSGKLGRSTSARRNREARLAAAADSVNVSRGEASTNAVISAISASRPTKLVSGRGS
jgi:hypothetical protein